MNSLNPIRDKISQMNMTDKMIVILTIVLSVCSFVFFPVREALLHLLLFIPLALISYTDTHNGLIRNKHLLLFVPGVVLSLFVLPYTFWQRFIAVVVLTLIFAVILKFSPGAIGGGDIKLLMIFAFILAYDVVYMCLFGFLLQLIPMFCLKKKYGVEAKNMRIAAGPYFALGFVIMLYVFS